MYNAIKFPVLITLSRVFLAELCVSRVITDEKERNAAASLIILP